jgi:hypothetical protein
MSHQLQRRQCLGIGALGTLGLSLPSLLQAEKASSAARPPSFGRAKSCILLFLSGGPPQHDTFDPKPHAPVEIRGDIGTIASSVPGLPISELLPLTAKQMHRLALIRSMTTDINSHSTSGAFMLSGYLPPSKAENVPPSPQDWPSIAAAVGALNPNPASPLSSVILPEYIYNTGGINWPCQTGGFMGAAWHPQLLQCDPTAETIRIQGMGFANTAEQQRLNERLTLLKQLAARQPSVTQSAAAEMHDAMQHRALNLLNSKHSQAAFDLAQESTATRDRYGRNRFGQSVLLGRRLIEAGVRLVQVNWVRDADERADSPMWDTHAGNAKRLREVLCPRFDAAFTALMDDLTTTGLIDETLVLVLGEFGRSPKINKAGGRDHWGNVFSVALAGAGLSGQVIGASDRIGALPADRPVRPPDLAATIFHLLGIDPRHEFLDSLQRPRSVTDNGTPLRELV